MILFAGSRQEDRLLLDTVIHWLSFEVGPLHEKEEPDRD
jgi:hypothetical protein